MSNTGIPGVYFNVKTNRYHATIRRKGKNYNAGYHKTVEEASAAVEKLRSRLDPPSAPGRKPASSWTENHPASSGEVFMPAPGTDQVIKTVTDENGAVLYSITTNGNQLRERN